MIIPLTLVLCVVCCVSHAQILNLKQGRILGFDHETKKGGFAEVFLNIPYASPPTGDLRFEKPVPPKPWKDIRDGTKFGSVCHPIAREAVSSEEHPSEDCLTLNIIRPKKEEAPSPGFPILLWIHGGGYEAGSAVQYGYKGFADIYTPYDIVVVTIQYRLGIYGFFSTGDSRIPGNLGLFDMAEAIKFIHTNAENFGGDPSRITLWGHSAGSAAVGQLMLSPVTRDYIPRSIEMSGSPRASWALGTAVANNSLELADVLGCGEDLKNCMKEKTVEEVYKGIEKVFLKWSAVIDGEFLQHPDVMIADAPPKVSVIGLTNKEAAIFTIMRMAPYLHRLDIDPKDYPKWNRGKLIGVLKEFIEPVYIGNHKEELINEVIAYYVDKGEEQHYAFYIDRYTKFLSDVMFNVPVADSILARREAGWDVYAYYLDHCNNAIWDENVPERMRGAAHASEFPYTKDVPLLGQIQFNDEEQVVADVFRQSFIEFVKIGAPSNHHEVWLDVGTKENIRYLKITPDPQMSQGFCNESVSFWHRMRKYGFDITRLMPVVEPTKAAKEEL